MAWCRCGPKVSEFNVDIKPNFGALSLDIDDDVFDHYGAAPDSKSQLTPIPAADEDDYDPRKPEFLIQASPEETDAKEADLVRQQMTHLKSMLARRREQTEHTPNKVFDHYEKVLEELGHILDSETMGSKIASPAPSPRARRRLFAELSEEVTPTKDAFLCRLPPSPVRSGCGGSSQSCSPDRAVRLSAKSTPLAPGRGLKGMLLPPMSPMSDHPPAESHASLGSPSPQCGASPSIASEGNVSTLAVAATQTTQIAFPSTVTVPPSEGDIHLPRECGRVSFPFSTVQPQQGSNTRPPKRAGAPCNESLPFSHVNAARMLVRGMPVSTILNQIQEQLQNFSFSALTCKTNANQPKSAERRVML